MAVVIRMKRGGRRNRPHYRIAVSDKRSPRDGRVIENLGSYDPISPNPEAQITLNEERARYWVEKGAIPSDTVRSILKRKGVLEGMPEKKKRDRSGRKAPTKTGARRVEAKKERTARRKKPAKKKAAASA